MAIAAAQFKQEVSRKVQEMRWEGHRWFKKFFLKELTREQVTFWHEQQFYVTGQAHELVAPLYLRAPDTTTRVKLLHNLLEEETGSESKAGPHPELFYRLGEALGSSRERYDNLRPLPEVAALRHYWNYLGHLCSFEEGLGAIAVAGEGMMPHFGSQVAKALEDQFGLTHHQTAAWWVHDEADKEHAGSALETLAGLCTTDEKQKKVMRAVEMSLEMMWLSFAGLYRFCVEDRKLP